MVEEKVPVSGYYCSRVQPFGWCREASTTSQQAPGTQDSHHRRRTEQLGKHPEASFQEKWTEEVLYHWWVQGVLQVNLCHLALWMQDLLFPCCIIVCLSDGLCGHFLYGINREMENAKLLTSLTKLGNKMGSVAISSWTEEIFFFQILTSCVTIFILAILSPHCSYILLLFFSFSLWASKALTLFCQVVKTVADVSLSQSHYEGRKLLYSVEQHFPLESSFGLLTLQTSGVESPEVIISENSKLWTGSCSYWAPVSPDRRVLRKLELCWRLLYNRTLSWKIWYTCLSSRSLNTWFFFKSNSLQHYK